MTCCKCGRSALGIASDGKPYCEQKHCISWKIELDRYRSSKPKDLKGWPK